MNGRREFQMPERNSPLSGTAPSDTDQSAGVPLMVCLLLHSSLTARRAAATIGGFTSLITVARALLERMLGTQEYPTIGRGVRSALQTVTAIGYGDVTPNHAQGLIFAAILMLSAIGFWAVITVSVPAPLIESSRRRFIATANVDVEQRLDEVNARLARIKAAVGPEPLRS